MHLSPDRLSTTSGIAFRPTQVAMIKDLTRFALNLKVTAGASGLVSINVAIKAGVTRDHMNVFILPFQR
jgi:hypothetical protein